ncbi:MAG: leucine-rich repeat domain-containing protein [Promethearchaeota archaeon]
MGLLIFVSHSAIDVQIFRIPEIAKNLTAYKEIDNVLYYEGDMPGNFIKYIRDNLDKCDVMLLFCSPNALQSPHVEKEWTAADASDKPIIPVFVKTEHIPTLLRARVGIEFDIFDLQINIQKLHDLILMKAKKYDLPVSKVQPSVKKDSPPIALSKDFPTQVISTIRKYVIAHNTQDVPLAKLAQRIRVKVDVLEPALENLILNDFIRATIQANVLVLDSEWNLEKVGSYQGTSLIQRDVNILVELERQVGKIPQVAEIGDNTFGFIAKANHVTGLGLYNQRLKSLPSSFGNLSNLVVLRLSSNHLKTFPENFKRLTSLQTLDLSYNELKSLPGSFGNLVNLKELYLQENQLHSLPESLCNLTQLVELRLWGNQLRSLPEIFGHLTNLTFLNLNSNKLQSLPESFGNLIRLEYLYLESNQLQSLPGSFRNLSNLQTLYLHENQLRSLPETFGQLQNLETLRLQRNQLKSLPRSFGNLTRLEYLYLESNQLQSLPESFGQLPNLQTLNLFKNQLKTLPETFGNLRNLQNLRLTGNPLVNSRGERDKVARLVPQGCTVIL